VLLARIKQTEESWQGQLGKRFREDFYKDSPLALSPQGKPEVLSAATPEALAEYHKQHVKAGSSVLAVYGRFDLPAVKAQVQKLFADLPAGENAIPSAPAPKVKPEGETFVHPGKTEGAGIMVAVPGMKITDLKDRLPITVLTTIISGYQLPRGWLFDDLRGAKLVYVAQAYNSPALVPGAFQAVAHSEPDKADLVAKITRDDLRKACTYAFSQQEIDEAVNIVLTADLLDNQSMSSLAMQAALDELYGFGYDFRARYEKMLRAVTPAEVSAVAKKYLGGGFMTVIVRPENK
jgi:zinc protease